MYVCMYVCIRGICVFNPISLLTIKARYFRLTILLYLLSLLCWVGLQFESQICHKRGRKLTSDIAVCLYNLERYTFTNGAWDSVVVKALRY
jgi:hypothetical protein